MEMAVDPWMISYLNMKHGRQVMKDPEFRKWLLKEDESFRVRSGGTKVQVGWAPLSKHAVFHKSYGDS
jgi:hypothetical protein